MNFFKKNFSVLDSGCSILDAGYSILDKRAKKMFFRHEKAENGDKTTKKAIIWQSRRDSNPQPLDLQPDQGFSKYLWFKD
jgi:hypothetical protein